MNETERYLERLYQYHMGNRDQRAHRNARWGVRGILSFWRSRTPNTRTALKILLVVFLLVLALI